MSGDKRFIDGTGFEKKLEIEEFDKKWKKLGPWFNEDGIVSGCPRCEYCQNGFINIDLPNIQSSKGKLEFQNSKERMSNYLENHIQKLVNQEIEKIKPEIESKIRENFKLS